MVALTRLVLVVSALIASVIAAPAPVSRAASKSGQGTFFAPGLGACGIHNSGSDMIVAVSQELFDHFPGAGVNPNKSDELVCSLKD
ncbi:hypothetical protein EW146_g2798 [Bondarzewia mesenterica]|uniref:Uncharacterized protein n=1 Tax=Bondarzewia mesenterica TaxID=1095465 RepID=A0A4V3XFN4_9AGAM|nr:hypothetical protein EW146_g2798 [Bondarzewia mesenterica]